MNLRPEHRDFMQLELQQKIKKEIKEKHKEQEDEEEPMTLEEFIHGYVDINE